MSDTPDQSSRQHDATDYITRPIALDDPTTITNQSTATGRAHTPKPTRESKAAKAAKAAKARRRGLVGRLIWGLVTLLIGALIGALFMVSWLVWLAPVAQKPLPNPSGQGAISLTVDDAFLTNVAQNAANTAGLPVTITNVHAHIQANGTIAITGVVPGFFILPATSFSALAQPLVVNGHLTIHLLSGEIGGAAAPTSTLQALESSINQQLSGSALSPTFNGVQYVVTGVTTTNGEMTVKLGPKPN